MPAQPAVTAWHGRRSLRTVTRYGSVVVAGSVLLLLVAPRPALGQGAPPAAEAERPTASAERLKLTTSDGVALAAWYYPAAQPPEAEEDDDPVAAPVVILLHELGGSHESVAPLAAELQARGIAVVTPDLRAHGESSGAEGRADADPQSLKKADFELMTMTGGGRVRDQAANRGDVEAVRNWIKERAAAGRLDMDKLVVVGSGVGAAVAAQWTLADAGWPDLASGPQGSQVRGLVMVSPAWVTRGYSIVPFLGAGPLRRSLPILVIGGTQDADAVKLYEQLKRARPDQWNEKRAGQDVPVAAPKLAKDAMPSLYLRQFDAPLSGDRLAAAGPDEARGAHPADIIEGFVYAVTAAEP